MNREVLWEHGIIAPWYLRESQKDIYLTLVRNKNPFVECARRFGKTTSILVYITERLIQNPGRVCTWCEPDKNQAREIVMPEMEKIYASSPKHMRPRFVTTDSYFLLPNGSRLKLRGVNHDKGDSARGPASDYIVADEFGFWRDSEYIVDSALSPQLDTTDGQFIIASTPSDNLDHPYYAYRERAVRDLRFIQKTIHENESYSKEKIEELCRERGGKDSISWKREYLCEAISDPERLVIREYDPLLHDIPDDHGRPAYFTPYVGVDLGFNDNTFIVFGYFDFERTTLVIEDELCVSGKNSQEIASAAKEIEARLWPELAEHGVKPYRFSDNDLQQIHDLHSLCGYTLQPTAKDDKMAAINGLRLRFGSGKILIKKRCTRLRNQLRVGLWKENRKDFERGKEIGHLDGIMSLVYLNRNISEGINPFPTLAAGVSRQTHFIPENLRPGARNAAWEKSFMPYKGRS